MSELTRRERVKRWANARRWAERINKAIDLGYAVEMSYKYMRIINNKLTIKDGEIVYTDGNVTYLLFENNPKFDHGLYETVEEWNFRQQVKFYKVVSGEEIDELTANHV